MVIINEFGGLIICKFIVKNYEIEILIYYILKVNMFRKVESKV